jgi:hypothetical protein
MKLKYHQTLTQKKWSTFSTTQQILMIANELNRAGHWIKKNDFCETKFCYERAIELLCLTVETLNNHKKLRELLRLKEMLAMLYTKKTLNFGENSGLIKTLLLLDPDAWKQLANF